MKKNRGPRVAAGPAVQLPAVLVVGGRGGHGLLPPPSVSRCTDPLRRPRRRRRRLTEVGNKRTDGRTDRDRRTPAAPGNAMDPPGKRAPSFVLGKNARQNRGAGVTRSEGGVGEIVATEGFYRTLRVIYSDARIDISRRRNIKSLVINTNHSITIDK